MPTPDVGPDAADAVPSEATPKAEAQPAARTTTSAAETSGFFQENMKPPSIWTTRGSAALMRTLFTSAVRAAPPSLFGGTRPIPPSPVPPDAADACRTTIGRYVWHRRSDLGRPAARTSSAGGAGRD